jgi:uncharacterized protein (TIGR04551 family)
MNGRPAYGAALLAVFLAAAPARAEGQEDAAKKEAVQVPPKTQEEGTDVDPLSGTEKRFSLGGYYRVRGGLFFDLDLNRGPTPSLGEPIWPEPLTDDPQTGLDMRLRLEPNLHIGWGVWVHAQVDMLDNLRFGQSPDTTYAFAATQQLPPEDSVRVKKAYGEVLLPFGVFSAGRMGALVSWGTGMVLSSGDCLDCDRGDAGDRLMLAVPLFKHVVALAFDIASIGASASGFFPAYPVVNVDRKDDVRSLALSFFRFDDPPSLRRKLVAGKTVLNYGLLFAARWQSYDVDLSGAEITQDQLIWRGARSFLTDLWLRLNWKRLRVELEFAVLWGRIDNASIDPGVEIVPDITALQTGGVLEVEWETPRRFFGVRLDVAYASGDEQYGMGANPGPDQLAAKRGDLDGPQFEVPGDTTIQNFRFNPDFIVDQIFWRRLVGRVTDAVVFRPTAMVRPADGLELSASSVTSMAVFASSTPGGSNYLGTEIDVAARYLFEPGFLVQASYGIFFPGAGMDNNELGLEADPAHLVYLLLGFRF